MLNLTYHYNYVRVTGRLSQVVYCEFKNFFDKIFEYGQICQSFCKSINIKKEILNHRLTQLFCYNLQLAL